MQTTQTTDMCNTKGIGLERTRYFPRQIITPDDLTQDQTYLRDKMRRHNRMLHGWGVVCGAWVTPTNEAHHVCVEAGYILSPQGDEIVIESPVKVDLFKTDVEGNSYSACGQPDDIWCSDVRADLPADEPVYLAVKYDECMVRPVQVPSNHCNGGTNCEYSRIRSSFTIRVLTDLPATYSDPLPQPGTRTLTTCGTENDIDPYRRQCPACPESPWVILAKIQLPGDGELSEENIDNLALRRYVVSFAEYYFVCGERDQDTGYTTRPGYVAVSPSEERLAGRVYENVLTVNAKEKIEQQYGGNRAAIGELQLSDLNGISSESNVVRAVGDARIEEVIRQGQGEFLMNVMKTNPEASPSEIANEVERIFKRVQEAEDVLRFYRGGSA